jgi:D-glycero-D-manno-heptose 1,7-bisphosphate phosphatase
MTRKPLFLDRDGVLNRDIDPYVARISQLEIFPYTGEALRMLHEAGYDFYVVSNQQGVSLGITSPEALEQMSEAIQNVVRPYGFEIRKFYYCTWRSESHPWRKPACGMLHAARDEFGIDLEGAFVIGDKWSDIQMGAVAGCRPLLVMTGVTAPGTRWDQWRYPPERAFENLLEAARWICEEE